MLHSIRAPTLTMPSFGHNLSLTGTHKMDGYGDVDPWSWSHQSNAPTQSYPAAFDPTPYHFGSHAPQNSHPRHHSIATSHLVNPAPASHPGTATPPPARQQAAGPVVKAQPAFKPTWHGFLDTTKDAMTIVEAALQGRLSHISRRPHDKERAEMLTSGTILVYEENASGIKRWTDAVHWSPSRVMNNCLIYRQLVRALKPEEKRAALNPSCGSKRKRKESASPSVNNTGDSINNADDEFEHSTLEHLPGDSTPTEPFGKVYANFAQSMTPDQQRRFCGSLIDSYEFKEGGLMKKTISVKYQGTHHHIISYYSLEDVVNGKLKRPFQDPKLADLQPRPELLSGWKVNLEDEESKDLPLVSGYSQHLQPSHIQHSASAVQHVQAQGVGSNTTALHLQVPTGYWHGNQYNAHHSTAASQQYHHSSPPHFGPTVQQTYGTSPSGPYTSHAPSSYMPPDQNPPPYTQQPMHGASTPTYAQQPQATQHYPSVQSVPPEPHTASQYPDSQVPPVAHQPHYPVHQPHVFGVAASATPQSHTPVQQPPPQSSIQQHDAQRRASAPVPMQTYGQAHPPAHYQPPQSYYLPDQKYPAASYDY